MQWEWLHTIIDIYKAFVVSHFVCIGHKSIDVATDLCMQYNECKSSFIVLFIYQAVLLYYLYIKQFKLFYKEKNLK